MELLPQLHKAKTIKVLATNALEVELDVGFGTRVIRRVELEGIGERFVPKDLKPRAMHALVVLCGGKRLLVQADSNTIEGPVIGRVFLDEPVKTDGPWMLEPQGYEQKHLEVSTFFMHLKEKDFEVEEVKRILNRKGK